MSLYLSLFCNTLAHRGKILEEVLRKQGINFTKLSEKLPWTVKTIYRHFEEERLPFEKIAEYAKAIHYSFEKEFPELEKFNFSSMEEMPLYKTVNDVEYYRLKYEQMLERYNNILEKYNDMIVNQLQGSQDNK